ncbi:AAA family ATPase [Clostridium sp. AM49-4BH]|uniref:AAA family ATPase n=1 Tax=Clostridium sp. AM49-4BH TaxID=2293035 RepID=UPI0026CDE938
MKKAISIGIQGFSDLREQDCFFVDKTNFIKEWWGKRDVVTLIMRPRRFGKTLNMSMLDCFFLINMRTGRICLRGFLYGRMKRIGNCREHIL